MPLSDIFSTGRRPRTETLPFSPGEEAVTAYQQRVLPEISALVGEQAPIVGRSAAAGLLAQPENLRALAEQYFPTAQFTTPEAAAAEAYQSVAGPLGRRFTEETAPQLQALMAGLGASRSGEGVGRLRELYRQQVSDPVAEKLAGVAQREREINLTQDLARRQAQVGLLAPQDQTIAALLGQTLAIQPPEQTTMGMPGEQMGMGTQLGALAGYNALSGGLGGFINQLMGGAAGAGAGAGGGGGGPGSGALIGGVAGLGAQLAKYIASLGGGTVEGPESTQPWMQGIGPGTYDLSDPVEQSEYDYEFGEYAVPVPDFSQLEAPGISQSDPFGLGF